MERLTDSNKEIPTLDDNAEYWLKVYFKLKDYEDLEEQDRLLKLPCKVDGKIKEQILKLCSKSEAEAKLKELRGSNEQKKSNT